MQVTAKIGRNQKCPCGSGKKFKKCGCGRMFYIPKSAANPVANAYHEAAHAVFNVLLDFPIEYVTIVPSAEYVSHCQCLESSELGESGRIEGWRYLARLRLAGGPRVGPVARDGWIFVAHK
jgi:SEC-C motif